MKEIHKAQKEEIRYMLSEKLGIDLDLITGDSRIREDLGADSLDELELIMDLEKMFECVIPDSSLEDTVTLNDIYKLVERYAE
jgi:acyl carrier protein